MANKTKQKTKKARGPHVRHLCSREINIFPQGVANDWQLSQFILRAIKTKYNDKVKNITQIKKEKNIKRQYCLFKNKHNSCRNYHFTQDCTCLTFGEASK